MHLTPGAGKRAMRTLRIVLQVCGALALVWIVAATVGRFAFRPPYMELVRKPVFENGFAHFEDVPIAWPPFNVKDFLYLEGVAWDDRIVSFSFGVVLSLLLYLCALMAYGLLEWIVQGPAEKPAQVPTQVEEPKPKISTVCTDPKCECSYHKEAHYFERVGYWSVTCSNSKCGCGEHNDEVFDHDAGEWV